MTTQIRRRAVAHAGLTCIAISIALGGCTDQEPPKPGKPATLLVEIVRDSPGGICEANIEWHLEPRAMVGNEAGAVDGPIADETHFSTEARDGECRISFGKEGLRPGVWELATNVGTCTVLVRAPITAVRIDDSFPECEPV